MGFPPLDDKFIEAVHDIKKAEEYDQHMQAKSVAMGTLDENQVSGIIAMALVKARKAQSSGSDAQAHSMRELLHQILLDYIDNLNREIADLEAGFEAEFGDAWREQIALKILGEDDIPQRQPGESITDFRERLGRTLVEEMLNPDGSIKDKYKNDPDMRRYAEWAQKIYNRDAALNIANGLKNPATTNEQAQQMLDRLEDAQNSEQNTYAARALEGDEQQKEAVLDVDSNHRHDQGSVDQSASGASFLANTPNGQ